MRVLSLFDGISCGRLALERAGMEVDAYYASEIDNDAIKVTMTNYPDTIQLGDVRTVHGSDIPHIDLLIGGSPCQSISNLGDGSGLNGKSGLFYEYLRVLEEVKPKYFLLENVVGKREAIEEITKLIEVEPIMIDSALVSGQRRKRLYWANFPITQPTDKMIMLKDILQPGVPQESKISEARMRWLLSDKGKKCLSKHYASLDPEKAQCLTVRSEGSWNSNYVTRSGELTCLTPVEYERLQTLPDGYTKCIRKNKRYQVIGNAWTVDVIAHIFSYLK